MKKLLTFLILMAWSSGVFCQGIIIQPNAFVTVKSNAYLKTTGTAGLTIKSTSSGTGSLIDENGGISFLGTGVAHVEQYLTDNAWHLISPTTTNVTANAFYWSDVPQSWLTYHTESTNTWTYNTVLSTPMPVGQGWSVWLDNNTKSDAIATMTGALRTSNLSPSISYTDAAHGFNAVGNPFPSAIELGDGTAWTFTNTEQTIWVWNNATDNYLNRTTAGGGSMSNGIIPVGQGFFVHATNASPILTIPSSARIHNAQSLYKNTERTTNGYEAYMILQSHQGEKYDEVWFSFGSNGTDDFDNGYDASKLFGGESSPQLFIINGDRMQSINHMKTLSGEERIVPLGFVAGIDGEQTISVNIDHLPNTKVTLKDLKTNDLIDLNWNNTYNFSGSKQDEPDRFLIHFLYSPDDILESDTDQNNIQINSFDQKVNIYSKGEALNNEGQVFIYDMMGRLLLDQNIGKSDLVTIPLNFVHTCLIIKVIKGNSTKTAKIVLQ